MVTLATYFCDWLVLSRRILTSCEHGKRKMVYIELVKTSHLYGYKFFDSLQQRNISEEEKIASFKKHVVECTDRSFEYARRVESRPRTLTEEY